MPRTGRARRMKWTLTPGLKDDYETRLSAEDERCSSCFGIHFISYHEIMHNTTRMLLICYFKDIHFSYACPCRVTCMLYLHESKLLIIFVERGCLTLSVQQYLCLTTFVWKIRSLAYNFWQCSKRLLSTLILICTFHVYNSCVVADLAIFTFDRNLVHSQHYSPTNSLCYVRASTALSIWKQEFC